MDSFIVYLQTIAPKLFWHFTCMPCVALSLNMFGNRCSEAITTIHARSHASRKICLCSTWASHIALILVCLRKPPSFVLLKNRDQTWFKNDRPKSKSVKVICSVGESIKGIRFGLVIDPPISWSISKPTTNDHQSNLSTNL